MAEKLSAVFFEKIVKEELAKTAFRIQAAAKNNVPVDTGRLRNSITVLFQDDNKTAVIGTNVKYAAAVEFGTQPHIITPKTKKALKFDINGKEVFAKRVSHPGTQGRLYLTRAFQRHKNDLQKELNRRLSNR